MQEAFNSISDYYSRKKQFYKKVPVFISSTFEDMNSEREQIMKMGDKLHDWGLDYGLDIFIVDYRTGISSDASESGKTVSLCLEAIVNCRPFVIALIGNRIGWVPTMEDLPKSVRSLIAEDSAFIQDKYPDVMWRFEQEKSERGFDAIPFSMDSYTESIQESLKIVRECIGRSSITELELLLAIRDSMGVIGLVREDDSNGGNITGLKSQFIKAGAVTYRSIVNENLDVEHRIIGENSISICDYLYEQLQSRCREAFPEHFDNNNDASRKLNRQYVILNNECAIYSHSKSEEYIENIFINKEYNEFTIPSDCCTTDRQALLVNTLIEKYKNPVIFSLDGNLSLESFRLQVQELEPYFEYGDEAPVVFIVSKSLSARVRVEINMRLGSNVILVTGDSSGESFEIITENYEPKEIYSAIEGAFAKSYKRLKYDQLDKISSLEKLGHPVVLRDFIRRLNSIHNHFKLSEFIEKECQGITVEEVSEDRRVIEDVYDQWMNQKNGKSMVELVGNFRNAIKDKQWENVEKNGRIIVGCLEKAVTNHRLSEMGIDSMQKIQANYVLSLAWCINMSVNDENATIELLNRLDNSLTRFSFQEFNPYLESILAYGLSSEKYRNVSLLDYYASLGRQERMNYLYRELAGVDTVSEKSIKIADDYNYTIESDGNGGASIKAKVTHVKVKRIPVNISRHIFRRCFDI